MSLFGQVWVFSAAAFVLGALLAWFFLVRPMRRRTRELERRLVAHESSAPEPSRETQANLRGGAGDDDEPVAPTPATTRFAPVEPVEPQPLPAQHEPTEHLAPSPGWLERDSLQGYRHEERADEPWEQPEPWDRHEPSAAETTSVLGLPERGGRFDDVLSPEPEQEFAPEPEPEPEPAPEPEPLPQRRRVSLFEPGPYEQDDEEPRGAGEEPPTYAFGGGPVEQSEEPVAEQTHVLPKRQPRQSPLGGFDPPAPIQPSMRSVTRREPEDAGAHSGSLFEPSVAANGPESVNAPPARETPNHGTASPPGPFGPGSAMPRPGGGSPSEDFTVKASVTALRYCTPDSSQFPNMVAEVWFRTPADAERVGFRPLA